MLCASVNTNSNQKSIKREHPDGTAAASFTYLKNPANTDYAEMSREIKRLKVDMSDIVSELATLKKHVLNMMHSGCTLHSPPHNPSSSTAPDDKHSSRIPASMNMTTPTQSAFYIQTNTITQWSQLNGLLKTFGLVVNFESIVDQHTKAYRMRSLNGLSCGLVDTIRYSPKNKIRNKYRKVFVCNWDNDSRIKVRELEDLNNRLIKVEFSSIFFNSGTSIPITYLEDSRRNVETTTSPPHLRVFNTDSPSNNAGPIKPMQLFMTQPTSISHPTQKLTIGVPKVDKHENFLLGTDHAIYKVFSSNTHNDQYEEVFNRIWLKMGCWKSLPDMTISVTWHSDPHKKFTYGTNITSIAIDDL